MVFLGGDDEPTVKDYLESTDVLPTLHAAIEAMLKKYTEQPAASGDEKPPHPMVFLAEYLKRNNPRHNTDFAGQLGEIRSLPGYGDAEWQAPLEAKQ